MLAIVATVFEVLSPVFLLAGAIVCVVMGRRAGQRMEQHTEAEQYHAATKSRHSRRTAYRVAAALALFFVITMTVKMIGWFG